MSAPEAFVPPRSDDPRRGVPTIGAGVLAVLLGFYDLFGGGCGVLGFLGGGRGDVPDNPFLTSGQQRGFEGFVEAALVYDPVNAGIGMLVGMVGVLLIFAGGLQFSPSAQRGLVGRVAFGASMVVDGLQILWAVLWYILMWGPMVEYVRAITEGMPDQPPDAENLVGVVTAITVVFMAGVTSLYFAIKSNPTPPRPRSNPDQNQRLLKLVQVSNCF